MQRTITDDMVTMSSFSDDEPVTLAWARLGTIGISANPSIDVKARHIENIPSHSWLALSANRVADMRSGELDHHFATSIHGNGGYVPYILHDVITLDDGRQVMIFGHYLGLMTDVVIMKFATNPVVLRIDVSGSKEHISVQCEFLSGAVAFADTLPLTRMWNVKALKELIIDYMQGTSLLGPFQYIELVKLGQNQVLRGSVKVWDPRWMAATRTRFTKRRIFVKTSLVQVKLDQFFR